MASVLILSSHVAASRVGGGAQALALARLGIEPILAPTVLFGRHPGYGAPGGAIVDPALFASVLEGVAARGAFAGLGAVIAGYIPRPEHAAVAARALRRVRAASPGALFVVDPIMGDADKGLYVSEAAAEAIAGELVPLADLVTPNAWELERLSGRSARSPGDAVAAARALGRPVLVSSVAFPGGIGAVHVDADAAWGAAHPERPQAPRGAGDLLTALFTAARVEGAPAREALAVAVDHVAAAIDAVEGMDELPLRLFPTSLRSGGSVSLERIDG